MMKYITLVITILLFALAACSPSESAESSANALAAGNSSAATGLEKAAVEEPVQDAGNEVAPESELVDQLDDSYEDALSISGQLAVGTIQLEETGQAVTEEQAAELMPLWQVLQALSQSDMTAEIELEAVIKQIQETMTPQQIQVIAGMALTNESLDDLQNSGALAMGGPAMRSDDDSDTFQMPAGGGPGGGGPGGGPPAGGGGDMGPPPDGGMGMMDNLNEDGAVTLDEGSMQELMLTNMVVRLLQTKTGEEPAFGPGGDGGDARMAAMAAISEAAGLNMPEIQAELDSGKSLAEIVSDKGADLEAVEAALQEALAETPLPEDQDLDTFIDQLLNGIR